MLGVLKLLNRKKLGVVIASIFLVSLFGVFASGNGGQLIARPPAPRYCDITNPTNGEEVSGIVTITIDASRAAKLYIDGELVHRSTYSYDWDTTGASDGSHSIVAKVPGAEDTVTVTVSNGGPPPPPPNEAPVVTITNPADGATVDGTVTISVSVTDDSDSLTPDIYIDGTYITTASSYDWDTTAYADGSHIIYAEATDTGGLSGSDQISVTVDNSVPPPPDGDDWFYDTVSYGNDVWHYVDAGFGMINCDLSWPAGPDVDMYLYRPSDYVNYVVRAYTTQNPEHMEYDADENGLWGIKVVMYTTGATADYDLHVTYTPNTPDTTDPTCDITDPVNGETVYKTKYIRVTATDDRTVDHVDFFLDGALLGTDNAAPFSYAWDTTAYADGAYTITATAYDGAGNTGDATPVGVTVDQSAAPPIDVVKYAVISGISDYKAISDLSYCDEDATDWYWFLVNELGYLPENIVVLGDGHTSNFPQYDGLATEANQKAALENMVAMADSDDTILFITSGHGSGDGTGNSYLCSWDCGSGESGEDGDLTDDELAAILGNSVAAEIYVNIDHCYSGGMGPELMALGNAANIVCHTTCSDNGYGWDSGEHQNGLWTAYFLEVSWIGHYNSDPNMDVETVFDYALANYPKSGGDTPEEYDGDTGTPMVIC
jgi:hypothetical protein